MTCSCPCFIDVFFILGQVSQATLTRLSLMGSKSPTGRPAMGICRPRCDLFHRHGNLDLKRWLHWPNTSGRGKDLRSGEQWKVLKSEKVQSRGIPSGIVPIVPGPNLWAPLPRESSDESHVIHTLPISSMPAHVPWSVFNAVVLGVNMPIHDGGMSAIPFDSTIAPITEMPPWCF